MGNKKKIAVISAAVLVLAVAGAFAFGAVGAAGDNSAAAEPEVVDNRIPVDVGKPIVGDISVEGEFVGTVDPNLQVTVIPKAQGEVLEVNYDVGDYVEEGAILAVIDSTQFELNLAQTKASVANAQARADYQLAMARNDLTTHDFNVEGGYEASLANAEITVTKAEKAVKDAEAALAAAHFSLQGANVDREAAREYLTKVRDNDLGTMTMEGGLENVEDAAVDALRKADLAQDAASLGVDNAERALEAAKQALADAQQAEETTKVLTDEARNKTNDAVRIAEINSNLSDLYISIESLEKNVADCSIKAPISGVIETRAVDPHDMASPQAPVFTISNKDAMIVEFGVSDTALKSMVLGDSVKIDKNGVEFSGVISKIGNAVSAQTGLFMIEATVKNPPENLYSGSTVKVFAETAKAQKSIVIPIDAVYYDSGAPYVFVAENETAKKVFVETGISNDENIEILSGLTADDTIIVTWGSGLLDGSPIKLAGSNGAESNTEEEAASETAEE